MCKRHTYALMRTLTLIFWWIIWNRWDLNEGWSGAKHRFGLNIPTYTNYWQKKRVLCHMDMEFHHEHICAYMFYFSRLLKIKSSVAIHMPLNSNAFFVWMVLWWGKLALMVGKFLKTFTYKSGELYRTKIS